MFKKLFSQILLIVFFLVSFQIFANAQPGDPGDDPDKVPLDPGSWVLVAAGVGYGVKKWKENKQQNKTNSADAENEINK